DFPLQGPGLLSSEYAGILIFLSCHDHRGRSGNPVSFWKLSSAKDQLADPPGSSLSRSLSHSGDSYRKGFRQSPEYGRVSAGSSFPDHAGAPAHSRTVYGSNASQRLDSSDSELFMYRTGLAAS